MSALARFFTRTRIEGLVILLFSVGYLWEGHNVPDLYKLPGVPGPTVFPLLLGTIFALSGLWLMFLPAKQQTDAAGAEAATAPIGLPQRLLAHWHTGAMWGAILLYLLVMPELGFPLAAALLLTAFFVLLGETRWYVVLGLAIGVTLVIHVGFALGLNVRLPLGVLTPLAKLF
jgi:putative tricarboxylic transport membrane protein